MTKYCRLLLFILVMIVPTSSVGEEPAATWTPIPSGLTVEHQTAQSQGCMDCHTKTESVSMHSNPGVIIGCADCHGGDPKVRAQGLESDSAAYTKAKLLAHVAPKHPENWPSSANPKQSYTDLLKEPAEFIKFMNPGDLRVAPETCGGCHAKIVNAVEKSLMTTSAMLWGGASYNNNILPFKRYVLGESYDRDGKPRSISDPTVTEELRARGALDKLVPLPQWEVVPPGDIFRVFERGGLFVKSQFPEIGLPNPLEDPGRPDVRQSNRGPGTGSRISVPVINVHKTRLNDPHLSFLGTNEHPGDYRSSGCTACHAVYANDRDPRHSGPWAKFGHEGFTQTADPTIPRKEEGHPIRHEFSRAIPTSQCMVCHMHQPNMFVNSYLGYTMWDYEVDAPAMWPEKQKYPTDEEAFEILSRNPEEASIRGKWGDIDFLKRVSELNPTLEHTQFADYHGHGWNFRAIFKRDRKGHLLDKDGKIVSFDDPQKFKKAVHMSDIHVDYGMHCSDCHFAQDSHGDGHIYGEVAQQVEVRCQDCHGTVKDYASLRTSGPAAPKGGRDLSTTRTPFGKLRFEWRGSTLIQRSQLDPKLEWQVSQVRDSVDPKSSHYNKKSAYAKTVRGFQSGEGGAVRWGNLTEIDRAADLDQLLAHSDDEMACFTCHSSWVTSCAGCHLPIQANWKQKSKHYDGKTTRNWASYNPQVARDEMFQIGRHGPAKKNIIVPVRSSSALILSSTDINRQKIYIQQPPSAASGYSGQAFAPHFPHTVRKTETKQCTDCHVSEADDNNAIMTQLFLLGTNFVNFMGYNAWVATGEEGLEAIQVTEWEEPQAVIGSYLHKYAYPDWYGKHVRHGRELKEYHTHHGAGGETNTIQLRGEYLFTTAGEGGFRAYDVANIANKGFSERIVTAPVSPLGQDTHISTANATSFALPTNMTIAPSRKVGPENLEDPMHPIYHYAVITDSEEGLILVNVDTLNDGDPRNNFFERALTWNEGNVLKGARHINLAGALAYIAADEGIVVIDLDNPLEPKVKSIIPLKNVRATAIQFRYLFATTPEGLQTIDVTFPERPTVVDGALVRLNHATNLYLARTYAYVANGTDGLAIVDIERPRQPKLYMAYTGDGELKDVRDVKVATTNASLFAYVADGIAGFKVLQLTDPDRVPAFYGFSPEVQPALVAWRQTNGPALAVSKALDRDRAVDETGHQVSIMGRIGSRPLNLEERRRLYVDPAGEVFKVTDTPE